MGPNPSDEDWPNAGAAGFPKDGLPNAGADAAGLLPKLLEAKAGAVDVPAPVAVAQGDGLAPRAGAPPKAGAAAAEVPNGDGVAAAGAANAAGAGVLETAGCVEGVVAASPAVMPGYVVPVRIDSL